MVLDLDTGAYILYKPTKRYTPLFVKDETFKFNIWRRRGQQNDEQTEELKGDIIEPDQARGDASADSVGLDVSLEVDAEAKEDDEAAPLDMKMRSKQPTQSEVDEHEVSSHLQKSRWCTQCV